MSQSQPDATLRTAIYAHEQGQLQEAKTLYCELLEANPNHTEALHLLGVLSHQIGLHDLADELIGAAIRQDGTPARYHNNLGAVKAALDQPGEAESCFREALRLDPRYAEAYCNLGLALRQQGRPADAEKAFRDALRCNPAYADAHEHLAGILNARGLHAEAIAEFEETLRLDPARAQARAGLGLALHAVGRVADALDRYNEALQWCASDPEVHNNRGAALWDQDSPAEAIAAYREALRLDPRRPRAHNNLGVALQAQGELDEAAAHYRSALSYDPALAAAHNNLGGLLCERGDYSAAVACLDEAIRLDPDYANAHCNLGRALTGLDDPTSAIAHFREALRPRPDHAEALDGLLTLNQRLCDWSDIEELWSRARAIVRARPAVPFAPGVFLTVPGSSSEQYACAAAWAAARVTPITRIHPPFQHTPGPRSRLRLGYLSGDFRAHPVAYLAAELFELHDRARFDIYGYSIGLDDGSPVRRRIAGAVDRFVDLASTPAADAARIIHDDQVDILIDLAGYTNGARPRILALRPAPVQVSYLGYAGTSGAGWMDYLITDDFLTPPDQQPYFAERFVYLPRTFQINDRRRPIAPVTPARAECGLPDEGFVFCCFNNAYKITPMMFDLWMRLLRQVSGSVLWISEANATMAMNLRREARARGVSPERLVFAPKAPRIEDHLARYRLADLFLDTLPYNAHATCSDALWAGLPVLTCAGETLVSRVAGSLLRAAGLPELITTSPAEYESLALRLARVPTELAALRARLAAERDSCPLFDSRAQTHHLEDAFERMWNELLAGKRAA